GALLGVGGAAQTMVSGSVTPAAFGLPLAAALALAAVLGGAPPAGPLLGAPWLWGPSVLFPLAPVVGDAPPARTPGRAGLALLAWRRGRPLVASASMPAGRGSGEASAGRGAGGGAPPAGRRAGEEPAGRGAGEEPAGRGADGGAPVLEVPATAGHDALV